MKDGVSTQCALGPASVSCPVLIIPGLRTSSVQGWVCSLYLYSVLQTDRLKPCI